MTAEGQLYTALDNRILIIITFSEASVVRKYKQAINSEIKLTKYLLF